MRQGNAKEESSKPRSARMRSTRYTWTVSQACDADRQPRRRNWQGFNATNWRAPTHFSEVSAPPQVLLSMNSSNVHLTIRSKLSAS